MNSIEESVRGRVEALVRETIENLSRAETASCLVLVPSYLIDSARSVQALAHTTGKAKLTIVHSGQCNRMAFPEAALWVSADDSAQMSAIVSNLHTFRSILCLQPPLIILEKTITGDDSDIYSYVLIQAALRAIETSIAVSFDSKTLRKGVFFEKVRRLLDNLADMGIKIVCCEDIKAENTTSDYNLITEETVISQYNQGIRQIKISKKSIVTPLARDKARELDIVICTGDS